MADKNGHQKPTKLVRSTGHFLKSEYQKAIPILSKIGKHKEAGTADERDENDLAKYQMIIEEYNNQRLGN